MGLARDAIAGRRPAAQTLLAAAGVNGRMSSRPGPPAAAVAALCLAGCTTSPSLNILGSFFPAWMLCAAAGIVAAVVLRLALSAFGVNQYLIAPPLTYLSIAVAATLLVWLLWFGH